MQAAVDSFLKYLAVERNASTYTIKSYREDLAALAEYLADEEGAPPEPETIDSGDVRAYSAAMHEAATPGEPSPGDWPASAASFALA